MDYCRQLENKSFQKRKRRSASRRRRTDRKQLVVGQEWSDASFERSRNDILDDKRELLFEGDSWNSTMNLNYFNKTWPTSPARVCIYVWAFAHCQISMVKIKPPRKFQTLAGETWNKEIKLFRRFSLFTGSHFPREILIVRFRKILSRTVFYNGNSVILYVTARR